MVSPRLSPLRPGGRTRDASGAVGPAMSPRRLVPPGNVPLQEASAGPETKGRSVTGRGQRPAARSPLLPPCRRPPGWPASPAPVGDRVRPCTRPAWRAGEDGATGCRGRTQAPVPKGTRSSKAPTKAALPERAATAAAWTAVRLGDGDGADRGARPPTRVVQVHAPRIRAAPARGLCAYLGPTSAETRSPMARATR